MITCTFRDNVNQALKLLEADRGQAQGEGHLDIQGQEETLHDR